MNTIYDQGSYAQSPEPHFLDNPGHNCFPSSSAHRHEALNNASMMTEERMDRYQYSGQERYPQVTGDFSYEGGMVQMQPSEEPAGVDKETLAKMKKMLIGKSTKDCSICMNKFQKNDLIRQLPCKHYFHNGCIKRWFCGSVKCPLCRLDVAKYFEPHQN